MSSPCHIELFLTEKESTVKAEQVRAGGSTCRQPAAVRRCAAFPQLMPMIGPELPCAMQDEGKERKLSKQQLAQQLRSGTVSRT